MQAATNRLQQRRDREPGVRDAEDWKNRAVADGGYCPSGKNRTGRARQLLRLCEPSVQVSRPQSFIKS
jgi:hypothetical protein